MKLFAAFIWFYLRILPVMEWKDIEMVRLMKRKAGPANLHLISGHGRISHR